ncbi:unnamed protein product [Owenia fusiformis]|uniref:Acireductone dioxygenase n=1 Tax=Owenia fusiformis TaxID=6347 RepID=A0A8S4N395_OWEFU|nr:unnamed protein product [Owenia fusiformis]
MVLAWYFRPSDEDQRLPHMKDPNIAVTMDDLEKKTGGKYWMIDPTEYQECEMYKTLRSERGYNYEDCIQVTDDKPEFQKMLKQFYEEHLHADEEVRFVLDGSGYFDVRDDADAWIRIQMEPGDLIVLPAGIYHRFTLDTKNFIKAVRLFKGEPVWTAHPRPSDSHPARLAYVSSQNMGS